MEKILVLKFFIKNKPPHDWQILLPFLELGPAAQFSNSRQDVPGMSRFIEIALILQLGRVHFDDLVVHPDVRHGHPVLR